MTDRKQQSVALLKLLGEDTAEAVLSHLPAEYADEIRLQIQGDPMQGMRTKQKRAVLKDFEWFFDFALKSSPRNLNVFDNETDAQHDDEADEREIKARLTTALFGAEEAIVDAIMENLSRRARLTIEEELQFMTRVPESKVTSARETVAELIAKIDQEGE